MVQKWSNLKKRTIGIRVDFTESEQNYFSLYLIWSEKIF